LYYIVLYELNNAYCVHYAHVHVGTKKGIFNLPKKLENLAKNQYVDWKQAYQEVKSYLKPDTSTAVEEKVVPQGE